jgi:rhodanese-related sulfurtransferase
LTVDDCRLTIDNAREQVVPGLNNGLRAARHSFIGRWRTPIAIGNRRRDAASVVVGKRLEHCESLLLLREGRMGEVYPARGRSPDAQGSLEVGEKNMKHSEAFLRLVDESRARVRETNVLEVKKRLDMGERFTLVDVREDNEWARGHISGAIHMGRGVIERDIEHRFPDKGVELVLYCGGGYRSALSADNLQKMGYTNVSSMDGGWRGWTEAGYPTETD